MYFSTNELNATFLLKQAFHTPYVTLYQSLCKHLILRGSVLAFEQIIPQFSVRFNAHLK